MTPLQQELDLLKLIALCSDVTIGYKPDGKRITKQVYGKTQDEVLRKVNPIKQEVFDKGYIKDTHKVERNFKVLLMDWFNTYKVPTLKSSATEENYRIRIKLHILPAFGDLDIFMVTSERIQRFLNNKVRNNELSVDQVRRLKQLLDNFFSHKMIKNIIGDDNPMDGVVVISERDDAEENLALKSGRQSKELYCLTMTEMLLNAATFLGEPKLSKVKEFSICQRL